VWAWGLNSSGQLGNNSTATSTVPVQVNSLTGATAVAGGASHSLALKSDGTVWAWGLNSSGQLGNNSTATSTVPVQVSALAGAAAIAAGSSHSLTIKSDGSEWSWGNNANGELGNNSTANSLVPVQVNNVANVIAIAGGAKHTLEAESDRSVWAQGGNTSGQLGNNSTTDSHVAVRVNGLAIATKAAYSYSADGLRMSKSVSGITTQFTWDVAEGLPVLLVDGATDYIYGPGGLPLEQVSGADIYYFHHDQLGSTRALTDAAGAVAATYSYDPYGTVSGQTGSVANPFGYAGQYTDPETGFQYLRARYFDSATGQFVTRDPLAAQTGSPYGYASYNPVNGNDPTGLFTMVPPVIEITPVGIAFGVGAVLGAITERALEPDNSRAAKDRPTEQKQFRTMVGGRTGDGCDAHHIVPRNQKGFDDARRALDLAGIDYDDPTNGALISREGHNYIHNAGLAAYRDEVNTKLGSIPRPHDPKDLAQMGDYTMKVEVALQELRKELELRYPCPNMV
jgi:RHS repeat-associated protein